MSVIQHRRTAVSALAQDRLGAPAILSFVMAAAAPFTVLAVQITTGYSVTGVTGLPLAFLIAAVILGLFSVGYAAMARRMTNAGALYTFIAHGLGRPFGVGGAWVALIAYNVLQVGLYGAIGSAAGPLLSQWFGIDVRWYVVALAAWAITAVLGVLRVELNGMILAALLIAEVAAVLVFDLTGLSHPANGVALDAFSPGNLLVPGVGVAMVMAITGFVGFEGAAVLSEESRDPERSVPAATYGAVVLLALLYAASAWAMTVATGVGAIVPTAQENGPGVVFGVLGQHLGAVTADIGLAVLATGMLAAMISFHNTIARYFFALGREHVLPAVFGRTGRRNGAPTAGSIMQSAIGLAAILVTIVAGIDPLTQLFFNGTTWGGLGVLILLAATSISVLLFFVRDPDGETAWRRLIAPGLATLGLLGILALALADFAALLEVPDDDPPAWILPSIYLVTAVLGIGWALILRGSRPNAYEGIGLGREPEEEDDDGSGF
ncbi:APC family permease [Streptosporangiaceae bacterium NEAU-GS5]|nr:APC family permease [Streptosporangiaceae bacterium NEAU-GS5]